MARYKARRVIKYSNLGNIASDLKRTIKWDPKTETFIGDTNGAATKKMHYEYRKGWKLV